MLAFSLRYLSPIRRYDILLFQKIMRPQGIKYDLPLGVSLTLAEIILLLVIAGLVKLQHRRLS